MIPLLAVFVLGTGKYGRQWLDLKLFYLQPAELLKVSLPMMVAWYLHRMPLPPRFSTVMVSAVIIGVPTGLVMLQPDFGTGVLIAASGAFVLLLAGLLVGLGTRYGSGCTSGHGICGLSRRSPRSIVATLAFMAAGFLTVWLLRHAFAPGVA